MLEQTDPTSLLEIARDLYRRCTIDRSWTATYPYEFYWEGYNRTHFDEILRDTTDALHAVTAARAVPVISDSAFSGDFNRAVDWYRDYAAKHSISLADLPSEIAETKEFRAHTVERDNRPVSPNFFRYYITARQALSSIPENIKAPIIIELGAGSGDLARIIKLLRPDCSYIVVDLPETIVFSLMFLRTQFPDKRFNIVANGNPLSVEDVRRYDFTFVPANDRSAIEALAGVDLFINTCSLGEMKNSVIRYWVDVLENRMRPRFFFGVNRFLNVVSQEQAVRRQDEMICSTSFGRHWHVRSWQLEPGYMGCPYWAADHPRYLEVLLENRGDQSADQIRTRYEVWSPALWRRRGLAFRPAKALLFLTWLAASRPTYLIRGRYLKRGKLSAS